MSAVSINFSNLLHEAHYYFSQKDFKSSELKLVEALVIVTNERRFDEDTINEKATDSAVA